ncbi:MAG: hypothetical protein OHK0038_10150 [Flammeovirgaceae bacterium]
MIFVVRLLILIIVTGVLQYFLPWWTLAIPAFLMGLTFERGIGAFLVGFLGILILWGGFAFVIDYLNESILSAKIAELFQLPTAYSMIAVTAVLGGILGGSSSLSGNYFRQIFLKPMPKRR